jgi:hypothetical protein
VSDIFAPTLKHQGHQDSALTLSFLLGVLGVLCGRYSGLIAPRHLQDKKPGYQRAQAEPGR